MFSRVLRHALLGVFAGVLASTGALAAGLSANQSATVLGQPLDFPVQVRLDSTEPLTADCVNAEVLVADQRLPATAVRTLIDQQGNGLARVRVQTQQAIDEPVISITLRVGCAAPISRRFVVFADPPAVVAAAAPVPAVMVPPLAPAVAAAPVDAQAAAAPKAENRSDAPTAAAGPATAGRAGGAQAGKVERQAARPARPAAAAAGNGPAAPKPPARSFARATDKPATDKPATDKPAAGPTRAAAPAGPRLTLEAAVPPPAATAEVAAVPTASARAPADAVEDAMQAVSQAASAARMAASAASASLDRMASLEQTVTQLRAESAAQQALVAQLRSKLDHSPSGSLWVWPLLLMATLLGGLSAWLAWRLGRLQAARQLAWTQQQAAAAAAGAASTSGLRSDSSADRQSRLPTGPAPFISSDVPTFPPRSNLGSLQSTAAASAKKPGFITQPILASRVATAARPGMVSQRGRVDLPDITPLDTPMDEPMARTEPIPAPLRGGDAGVRDVSIEELIDLEQQAEFFVVLGQDEAAIDLLVDHLRSTGGGSPLPYLKLLEIYSRTNDRSAYERNRARFNHRFNAYAPDWGSDLAHGRALEDYPGILPRLEQVWPRPLDAMAELEALLFRKSRGELFELPAYREVLFLYALARDLLDREAISTGSVDLLLPLADGSAFGATSPIPFLYDEAQPGEPQFDFDDRPTAPVDFDLTIPAQQTSMFDPMDEPLRPRRR